MSYFETLPEITPRQEFVCDNGHGVCTPIQVNNEYYRVTDDSTGEVIYSKHRTEWVSDCCHSGVCVWDNDLEDVVIE